MGVSAVTTTTLPVDASGAASKTEDILGKDTFLKLLVTQLRYQNPMNPMSNEEFLSQSAQFSALEEMRSLNANVGSLIDLSKTSSRTAALGLMGKHVEANYSEFSLSSGTPANLSYSLAEDASVTITISNADGTPVRTINVGEQSSGNNSFSWDGLSDTGIQMPDGQFSYAVSAANADGVEVEALENVSGVVDGIILEGEPQVSIGGALVPLWAVNRVLEGSE